MFQDKNCRAYCFHEDQGGSHYQMYQTSGLLAAMLDLQVPCFEGLSLKIWTFLCKEAAAVGQCSGNT